MTIINGLIVAVFLILVTASVAGGRIDDRLDLFDLALSRKRPSGTTAVIDGDPEITNRSNLEMAFSNWRRERGGEAASGNNQVLDGRPPPARLKMHGLGTKKARPGHRPG